MRLSEFHVHQDRYALYRVRMLLLLLASILSFYGGQAQTKTLCEDIEAQGGHGFVYLHKTRAANRAFYIPVKDTTGKQADRVWLYKDQGATPVNAADTLTEIFDYWIKDDLNWLLYGEKQDTTGIHYIKLQATGGVIQRAIIDQLFYDYFDSAGYIGFKNSNGFQYVDTTGLTIPINLAGLKTLYPVYHLSRNIALVQSFAGQYSMLALQGTQYIVPPGLTPDQANPDKLSFDESTTIFSAQRAAAFYYLKLDATGAFAVSPTLTRGDPIAGGFFTRVKQGTQWEIMDKNFGLETLASAPDSLDILQFFANDPTTAMTREYKTDTAGHTDTFWVKLNWDSTRSKIIETPMLEISKRTAIRPLHAFPSGSVCFFAPKNKDSLSLVKVPKWSTSSPKNIRGRLDSLLIDTLPGKGAKRYLVRTRGPSLLGQTDTVSIEPSGKKATIGKIADSVFRSSLLHHRYLVLVHPPPAYGSKIYDLLRDKYIGQDPTVQFVLALRTLSCSGSPTLAVLETLHPGPSASGVTYRLQWIKLK